MTPEMAFAKVLMEHRRQSGLTQEQVAERSGLDRTYISLLERGKRQPSLATLLALAGVLGVSASSLVAEVEGDIDEGRQGSRPA